jgi:uncharacterized secreted protein with C-terminal beta-propeller domain
MKNAILIILLAIGITAFLSAVSLLKIPEAPSKNEVKRFSSYEEIKSFLKTNVEMSSYYGPYFGAQTLGQRTEVLPTAEQAKGAGVDYSTTNIQVAGVDEADIVKNDGKYIYIVSGKKIVIVDAYPAKDAKILSEIELNGTPGEIFVNGNKLVVFGQTEYNYVVEESMIVPGPGILPPRPYSPETFIKVYDISDRQNPVLKRNVSLEGNYFNSRMIGDYVYAIVNQPVYFTETEPVPLPVISSGTKTRAIAPSEIYYFDFPDSSYIFTNVLAINTQDDSEGVNSKTFLMGYSQNMYVSTDNIYVVYNKRVSEFNFYDRIIEKAILPSSPSDIQDKINEVRNSDITQYEKMRKISEIFQNYLGTLNPEDAASIMKNAEKRMEEVQQEIAKEMEKTVVHKIYVNNGNIEYRTNGEVPGYVLNQFSMDEHDGYLRMATTTGSWRQTSSNHVYVLDSDLKIVGRAEDLAAGERIYSARFIGDKGYMVTFRQVDPLFVIDLSDPSNPRVLGYLKIPGVSDYLHPYDETHVIGVGRDATEQGRIKGMKLSLFDVSDVENPKEVSKYYIGESGTDSDALRDHKAFLFSKSKNLLVIPVRVSEGGKWDAWQGAYIFNIDLSSGFTLKGKVTHANETVGEKEYYYDYYSQVRRSLYIDDVLYTVSSRMIKMNELGSLVEINKIVLPTAIEEPVYRGI